MVFLWCEHSNRLSCIDIGVLNYKDNFPGLTLRLFKLIARTNLYVAIAKVLQIYLFIYLFHFMFSALYLRINCMRTILINIKWPSKSVYPTCSYHITQGGADKRGLYKTSFWNLWKLLEYIRLSMKLYSLVSLPLTTRDVHSRILFALIVSSQNWSAGFIGKNL